MAEIELSDDPSSSNYNCNTDNTDSVNDQLGSGMNPRLLKACSEGNRGVLSYICDHLDVNMNILKEKTPYGNTALHLAVMLGYDAFARKLWLREPLLLTSQNNDGETPLIAALMAGNKSMARELITAASSREPPDDDLEIAPQNCLCEMLEIVDLRGQNALHHALCSMPNQDLALHILDKVRKHQETAICLSRQVNNYGESAMHIACRRGYPDVVEELLTIPESSDQGPKNTTAMHTAVVAQQIGIVDNLLKKRPQLARRLCNRDTPLTLAIATGNLLMVETFMRHDPSLAYIDCMVCSSDDEEDKSGDSMLSPFMLAANLGRLEIAMEIARHCPDSAYYCSKLDRSNALHRAVQKEKHKMVEYLIRTPQFRRLINQGDSNGKLPLHYAAEMCNTEVLGSLLSHEVQDCTAVTVNNESAFNLAYSRSDVCTTQKWNDAHALLLHQMCFSRSDLLEHRAKKKKLMRQVKEEDVKIGYSMPHYKNAALVAILIITITFVAVFSSLRAPTIVGYNTAAFNGLPVSVLATNQVTLLNMFLITYTIALLSSLVMCFSSTYLREDCKALAWIVMAFAYVATAIAFLSGLYLVAPKRLWIVLVTLAVIICIGILIRLRLRINTSDIWPQPKSRFLSCLHRRFFQSK